VCDLWLVPVRRREEWRALLGPDERRRLAALPDGPVRDTFLTSRGAQRLLLAAYLGTGPEAVEPARDCGHCDDPRHGRPYLPGGPVDFSVSHTDSWLLLAVVGTGRVGADLDALSHRPDTGRLAAIALTPDELRAHRALPAGQRRAAFLTAWVRKEAAMKVSGLGLAAPPPKVDVSGARATAPGVPAWPAEPPYLTDLSGPPGHAAALATTVPLRGVRRHRLAEPPPPAGDSRFAPAERGS
ncbi:4'-phosphopantetheinyl transferase superfamily protein, partial [Streptomyces sp. SM14]|uniref:4'-phosphopantetheinyl transferase family protein n=2 Tax=unclassified Streptomyces TaxID=2593676 RepID=UPI0011B011AF